MKKKINSTKDVLTVFKHLWQKPITPETEIPLIPLETVQKICRKSIKYLETQSLYLEVGYPLTIVGDIHGSLNDLFRILRLFKTPPQANYLFLGDYVDRGPNSVAVIVLLLSLFCEYPVEVTLLRGNHEFPSINKNYGFHAEIMKMYNDESLWELFNEVFSYMPLVAVVNDEIFCVHGGISPRIKTLREIKAIPMPFKGYDMYPPVADLLWSDPGTDVKLFEKNIRGTGQIYGEEAIQQFLQTNNLKLLVRAHQCTMKGVHSFSNEMGITIFSSSNYGGVCGNRCGVCRIGDDKKLYFYSLGADTEKSAHANAIMELNNKIGLQTPFSQESPVSSPKHIIQRKKQRSSTPQITRNILTPPKKKTPLNEKDDTLPSEIEMAEHPSLKFLREDTLNIEEHANTLDGDENEKRKKRKSSISPEEKANNIILAETRSRSRKKKRSHPSQEGEEKNEGDVFADIPKKKKKKKKASTASGDGDSSSNQGNETKAPEGGRIKSRPPLPPNSSSHNLLKAKPRKTSHRGLRKTKSQVFKPEKESNGRVLIPLMPVFDDVPPQTERKETEIPLTLSASSPILSTLSPGRKPSPLVG